MKRRTVLGSVGSAPVAVKYRLAHDVLYLHDGVSPVVFTLGRSALPEVIELLVRDGAIAEKASLPAVAALAGGLTGLVPLLQGALMMRIPPGLPLA
jgi:hypothetical protein